MSGAPKNLETIYNFIVKEIIRKYGSSQFKSISNNEQFSWIVPKDIFPSDFTVSDKYVLMGDDYLNLKGTLASCLHDNNGNALEDLFNLKKNINFTYIAIAFYRNITFLFKSQPDINVANIFEPVLNKHFGKQRAYWIPLLENSLMHNLKINEENCQLKATDGGHTNSGWSACSTSTKDNTESTAERLLDTGTQFIDT